MRRLLIALSLLVAPLSAAAAADDPYRWLEDIHGARALGAVTRWNAETLRALATTPAFRRDEAEARAILDDTRQIAAPDEVMGDRVTNFWRDAAHPKGIWRVSPLAAYLAGAPAWTTLIDLDALARAEGKSWVWHNAGCKGPEYRRCLIALSPGGGDADVVREWDMASRAFVPGGFALPEGKTRLAWEDADTVLVGADFGPGTLTSAGYPRTVRRWRRGTPLAAAPVIAEAAASDTEITPVAAMDGATRRLFVLRAHDFYHGDLLIAAPGGKLVPTPVPPTAEFRGLVGGRLVALLNQPLNDIPAGSLVAWRVDAVLAGQPGPAERVFTPGPTQAIEDIGTTDHVLWLKLLDDVSGRLLALRPDAAGRWAATGVALPDKATVTLGAGADQQDLAFATVESFLIPPTLYTVSADGTPRAVQALPARFDAARFAVSQRFATSKDGTKVPYFLVRPKGATAATPVLIHAYGGFRLAQTPKYLTAEPYRSGPLAQFWVEDGNAYVLANIRGGGEYGPAWHAAALREKRQNAYDDFHAVAEDLVRSGVTRRGAIAVSGRSNGGLLVGVLMTQRPELYGAVIAGSPLEDMQRYSHLLAGASWMAEYGDPDQPADWAFISRYSPYQNVHPGVKYPPALFYLSTEDDRVHPGHARKLAALLKRYGNRVWFHEAREGGHAVGGDHREDALRAALLHAFLRRELMAR